MDDRFKLPTGPHRLRPGAAPQEGRRVILYARAKAGELDRTKDWLRQFAQAARLDVVEEYAEEGKPTGLSRERTPRFLSSVRPR